MVSGITELKMSTVATHNILLLFAIVTLAIICLLYFNLNMRQRYANAPVFGIRSGETLQQARQRFRLGAKDILQEGYMKHKGKPFYVPTPDGEKLMLPPRYVDELKNLPDELTDAAEPVFQAFESKYTQLGSRELLHRRCIRNHLYQNIDDLMESLLDEVHVAVGDTIGSCEEWTDVPITKCITTLNARVLSRVFGGFQLSRNQAWVDAVIGSTQDGAAGALKLRPWPSILKPLIARFIPEISRIKSHYKAAQSIIVPLLVERRSNAETQKPNDFLEWMTQDARGPETSLSFIADMQLNIAFTGLFTSTAAIVQVLFDLCSKPDYIRPLRDEIYAIQHLHTHLDRVAISKLHKLDSFMKESQRFNPLLLITFTRWVRKDLRVLDLLIPKNTNIGVPAQAMTMDSEMNPSPFEFDGFRFSKLRSDSVSDAASYQWAAANLDNMAFGYGRVGCPGRQFASLVIKIILIELLTKYDIGTTVGGRPRSFCYDAQIFPDPEATIPFRSRIKK